MEMDYAEADYGLWFITLSDTMHSFPRVWGLIDNVILISYGWHSECAGTIIMSAVCMVYEASLLAPA